MTEDECPLLVVRSGEGLVWASLKEFAKGVEFIEAPFELAYALFPSGGDMPGFGNSSGLDGWEGETALFPSRSGYIDSRRFSVASWRGQIREPCLSAAWMVSSGNPPRAARGEGEGAACVSSLEELRSP